MRAFVNAVRPWQIYADLAQHLIGIARPLYAKEPIGLDLKETVRTFPSFAALRGGAQCPSGGRAGTDMAIRLRVRRWFLLAALALCAAPASGHATKENERLPTIGPAPGFALTDQAGQRLSLADLHDKVLAVTFIYATCKDSCPILTAKMAMLQRELGADFGPRVRPGAPAPASLLALPHSNP